MECGLVMLVHCLIIHHLDQLHHAAIFMGQNVAVVHKLAGKIGEPSAKFDVAGSVCVLGQREWKGVPPNPGRAQYDSSIGWIQANLTPIAKTCAAGRKYAAKGSGGIEDLQDLEGIHVNMER